MIGALAEELFPIVWVSATWASALADVSDEVGYEPSVLSRALSNGSGFETIGPLVQELLPILSVSSTV